MFYYPNCCREKLKIPIDWELCHHSIYLKRIGGSLHIEFVMIFEIFKMNTHLDIIFRYFDIILTANPKWEVIQSTYSLGIIEM